MQHLLRDVGIGSGAEDSYELSAASVLPRRKVAEPGSSSYDALWRPRARAGVRSRLGGGQNDPRMRAVTNFGFSGRMPDLYEIRLPEDPPAHLPGGVRIGGTTKGLHLMTDAEISWHQAQKYSLFAAVGIGSFFLGSCVAAAEGDRRALAIVDSKFAPGFKKKVDDLFDDHSEGDPDATDEDLENNTVIGKDGKKKERYTEMELAFLKTKEEKLGIDRDEFVEGQGVLGAIEGESGDEMNDGDEDNGNRGGGGGVFGKFPGAGRQVGGGGAGVVGVEAGVGGGGEEDKDGSSPDGTPKGKGGKKEGKKSSPKGGKKKGSPGGGAGAGKKKGGKKNK
mmetsp:Transcript_5526/g.13826  ORF Transcript_5526/g.13826 Transcript_5526/m.13826 type:complete len:336 (-) Transcript_5526:277-1284(-)